MPGLRNNQQQYMQADEETCSATLSDYFDHKENHDNQKRQARAFVKEAFCEQNFKLDVNQVQLMKQKQESSRPIQTDRMSTI